MSPGLSSASAASFLPALENHRMRFVKYKVKRKHSGLYRHFQKHNIQLLTFLLASRFFLRAHPCTALCSVSGGKKDLNSKVSNNIWVYNVSQKNSKILSIFSWTAFQKWREERDIRFQDHVFINEIKMSMQVVTPCG